ncbi:dCMP deaminase family protein [Prosthecochloris sp. N3]|uniref:dCMP deaminase family protein n=1 Tax=Prosthecochloris ethylica TaxID=2743976 RepID=A0ABR9XT12_9CHLB|nr:MULTISPECIES: dCMP deaminase family protein [Prosthecochloris]MEC9487596.1 dCMP deaminase family protein [Prosthecochloris sp.]MBF0586634.1 dCMP deaminase family protein [Prosthecochloris ethylica]MBF0637012.1 dCMP deaminase family protein [Prosthecochloris ethylica]NUK47883.1 dCMP deaminase family protein [Prosthecochloris ethylica]RNA65116.1 dCMP deaminase [Prosthecochloris sp. ZM_2]
MSDELRQGCSCSPSDDHCRPEGEERLGWHEYFMSVAHLIKKRATCTRGHVGAVIVRDNNILSTGYNGAPSGLPHCNETNCRIYRSVHPDGTVEENCVNTIHAEINAIAQAAKHGVAIKDADIYITSSPCIHCLKVLINVGIRTIYYDQPYKIEHISELLRLSGIRLVQIHVDSL